MQNAIENRAWKAYTKAGADYLRAKSVLRGSDEGIKAAEEQLAKAHAAKAEAEKQLAAADGRLAIVAGIVGRTGDGLPGAEDMDTPMLFRIFEELTGKKTKEIADLFGVSDSGYRNWRAGEIPARKSRDQIAAILEAETGGIITAQDFLTAVGNTLEKRSSAATEDEAEEGVNEPDFFEDAEDLPSDEDESDA